MIRSPLKGQVVAVTGGAGFIGSHLVDSLLKEGSSQVIIIDNMFLGSEDNLQDALSDKRAVLYKEDIELASSLEYIFQNHKIDTVFNCATKALNYSFLNPANAFSTNVTGILNLLELQRRGVFKTLCHFSTSEVYGTAIYEPMDESHPKNPTTTYAAGKASADYAVESYVKMFGVDSFIIRPFNNYGPRQNYKGMLAGVIPLTAFRILNNISPEIHGTGDQSRDFIHVQDTVNAVIQLYSVMTAGESINICADQQVSMNDLILNIVGLMSYQGEVVRNHSRKSDVECHKGSSKKMHQLIKLDVTPLQIGLPKTLDWYKQKISTQV